MTHTIEISDNLHDYITIELENVSVDIERSSYEGHGMNEVSEVTMTYDVVSVTNTFGDTVTLTKDIKTEMEEKIMELDEVFC